jgi:tryptophan 2,3-dioxygenase
VFIDFSLAIFVARIYSTMEISAEIVEKIRLLEAKYAQTGQDINAYLEGLIHAEYLSYWDYVALETLLSLQRPRTAFPDEKIFIVYHQITELYFNLCLHELEQLRNHSSLTQEFLTARVRRLNNYFSALTESFSIMIEGMEKEQFLQFRMSLLPASGFQSAQYRKIEIASTPLLQLTDKEYRERLRDSNSSHEELFRHIYWKAGATELKSGKKTYTLIQFENKYEHELVAFSLEVNRKTLWELYSQQSNPSPALQDELRQFDIHVNINWPLVHYKSAARYLQRNPADIAATGGTNWQKYLPPRFQKRIFFPELWSEVETENWGKAWVLNMLKLQTESIPPAR